MTKTKIKYRLLQELDGLSPAGRGEVLKYARWLLKTEKRERSAEGIENSPEGQDDSSHPYGRYGKCRRPFPAIQNWLSRLGSRA